MLKADTETSGEREPMSPKDLPGQAQSSASAFHNLIASVSPWKGQSSSPNLWGTGDQFCGRQFSLNQSWRVGGEGDFRMIQAHYIYWAFYFYYYYITSISDHQALDPDVGDP